MTAIELAWAAGLFDGEGSISIQPVSKRNCCYLDACVTNTDLDVLRFLHDRWGGSLRARRRGSERHKQPYRWRLAASQAASFLRDIEPYVVRNQVRARIEIALRFQQAKVIGRPPNDADDRYVSDQMEAYEQMRELNRRGVRTRPDRDRFRRAK